jgi:hypothetical protein
MGSRTARPAVHHQIDRPRLRAVRERDDALHRPTREQPHARAVRGDADHVHRHAMQVSDPLGDQARRVGVGAGDLDREDIPRKVRPTAGGDGVHVRVPVHVARHLVLQVSQHALGPAGRQHLDRGVGPEPRQERGTVLLEMPGPEGRHGAVGVVQVQAAELVRVLRRIGLDAGHEPAKALLAIPDELLLGGGDRVFPGLAGRRVLGNLHDPDRIVAQPHLAPPLDRGDNVGRQAGRDGLEGPWRGGRRERFRRRGRARRISPQGGCGASCADRKRSRGSRRAGAGGREQGCRQEQCHRQWQRDDPR